MAEIRENALAQWAAVDIDNDGLISFEEFVKFAGQEDSTEKDEEHDELRATFEKIDTDGNGYITLDEYVAFKFEMEQE